MALLTFPFPATNGQVYPVSPPAGVNIYQWSSVDQTWRLLGPASGVTAGTYGTPIAVPRITIDATGRITLAQDLPIQLGDTTQVGLVQLVDNTTSNDATKALTAAQGYKLQNEIGDLTLLSPPYPNLVAAINNLNVRNNLTFAGTINAITGQIIQVTPEGAAAGFTPGSSLPAPSAANKEYFVVVKVAGTFTPTSSPVVTVAAGDWLISSGTQWILYAVGSPAQFIFLDNLTSQFNGVLTSFTLTVGGTPISPGNNLLIFLGGVPQIAGAGAAYTVTGSTITFTEAPLLNSTFVGVTVA